MIKYGTKVKIVKVKPVNQYLMDQVSEILGYDLETERYIVRDTKELTSRWYMSSDCFEVIDVDVEKQRDEIEKELIRLQAELDKMPKKNSAIIWVRFDKVMPSALNLALRLGIDCWGPDHFDGAVKCKITLEEI